MQWRVIVLFFVRGWRAPAIARRFHVPKHRIWEVLDYWSVRAWGLGCLQVIDPEAFAMCCRADIECGTSGAADRSPATLAGGDGDIRCGLGAGEEEAVSHGIA
jgi:hypothetical protein